MQNLYSTTCIGALLFGVFINLCAANPPTFHLLDHNGQPILNGVGGCVDTPQSRNTPHAYFSVCGDDYDQDGVGYAEDICPGTPRNGTVDERGCLLDSDADGVADYLDQCKNNHESEIQYGVNEQGCPLDRDNDKIPDYRDKCPLTAESETNGCSVTHKKEMYDLDNYYIHFATGSAELDIRNKRILDIFSVVLHSMQNFDNFEYISIKGHADAVGTLEFNQVLSQQRADKVRDYLIQKGIPAAKLIAVGKGEVEPVASNANANGRAQNRRAETKILIMR